MGEKWRMTHEVAATPGLLVTARQFLKAAVPPPNRLAVYFTALAALAAGVLTVVGDLDFQSTVGVLGSVAVLAGVVAKWLSGWQQYERAVIQHRLMEQEHAANMEAVAAVSKPGGRKPNITVPR